MAKNARAFRINPDDGDGVDQSVAVTAQDAAPKIAPEVLKVSHHGAVRPAYRKDRKNLSVWLDEKAFRHFKSMIAEEGGTMQDYLIEMINREFARKGRPQIAK